ncbi:EamA family transporter [Aeromicrobium sp. Leaf350]|uniref:EamA family transporter n=1 Tax=Aeromicrobium sp. Leaf350 TaxID=2876565 RepID=UPI001E478C54|nr:EamA family transporter [Aeromicrobium sp. Leaf350]
MSTPSPAPTRPWIGYAFVLTAAVLFAVNAGMSRVPLRSGTDIETFTAVRVTGALLVLVLIALLTERTAFRLPRGRQVPLVIGLGLVGVAGLQGFYNVAIDRLPLSIALLVEYLGPVWVVLWVRFVRREPVQPRMWPALGLALVGLALVGRIWSGVAFDGIGLLAALAAGLCFAAYFLLGEHDTGSMTPLAVILWAFLVATVVLNVVQPFWTADQLGSTASMLGRLDHLSVPAWVAMTSVVVLGTTAPFFLLLLALRHLPAMTVSVVAMLEPAGAVVVGWLWFAESLAPVQVLGVLLVLGGIVLAQTSRRVAVETLPPTPV